MQTPGYSRCKSFATKSAHMAMYWDLGENRFWIVTWHLHVQETFKHNQTKITPKTINRAIRTNIYDQTCFLVYMINYMLITCEPWKCRLPAASSPPRRRGPGREGGRTSFFPEENKYDHDDVYDIRCERVKNRSTEAIVIMMITKRQPALWQDARPAAQPCPTSRQVPVGSNWTPPG